MMPTSTASDFVTLAGGLSVPLNALQTLWAFEDRGLTVRLAADGALLVGPRDRLTPADREAILAYRDQLVSLVRYCDATSHA
jgi:hypothetical protein